MATRLLLLVVLCGAVLTAWAQDDDNTFIRRGKNLGDTATAKKEIPKHFYVWSVDRQFGDITRQPIDTVTHLFQNTAFTQGLHGEYNTLGTLGSPRLNRIATDRRGDDGDFFFTEPYSYFLHKPDEFLFTNTLSPYANLSYLFCGNRTNGEDNFRAKFAVNAGKRLGVGFDIHYLYGRGYYSEQSTSLLNTTLYGSYRGDQYVAHLIVGINRIKVAENGGITNDDYITHPENFDDSYATSEIPTMLEANWNRNSGFNLFLTHRYSLGFHRRVPMTEEEIAARQFAIESQKENDERERRAKEMGQRGRGPDGDEDDDNDEPTYTGRPAGAVVVGDDSPTPLAPDSLAVGTPLAQGHGGSAADRQGQGGSASPDSLAAAERAAAAEDEWMKDEFVPVTSFIHTLEYTTNHRIYQAYRTPADYYAHTYYDSLALRGDSIYDQTRYRRVRNTLAIALLEGFSRWAFASLKAFATSDLQHYTLPDTHNVLVAHNTHNLSIGAQMCRRQGHTFHYNAAIEAWLMGDNQGQVKVQGDIDLHIPLARDTLSFVARAYFGNEQPNYYLRHYHAKHFWWDDDLSKQTHTRLEAVVAYPRTHTTLRFAADLLTNYTYLCGTYRQDSLGRWDNAVVPQQHGDAITLLTAAIEQRFVVGPLNWETVLTWQHSTNQDVLPVPTVDIYTNLYLRFRIARVLLAEMGADMRYFTRYAAPDYSPALGQYVVQGNDTKTTIGAYPTVNVYMNFNLKGTRFFIMYTHLTYGTGNSDAFLTPHYPLNRRVLRLGLSWNFFN